MRHRIGTDVYIGCDRCGSAWLRSAEEFVAPELFGDQYFAGGVSRGGYVDYDADAPLHRRNAGERMGRVARYLPIRQHPLIVDVGCASGYVLDAAASAGWLTHGVDVSDWARRQTEARGHHAHASLTAALEAAPHPDAITFFQSLEHFDDPAPAVGLAAAALPPGGVLAIETWDADSRIARISGRRWQQVNPPSVRHLFTQRGVRVLLEHHGLHVVESRPTAKSVSPRLVAGVIAHRAPKAGGSLLRLAEASKLGDRDFRYRLGDLVTIIAIKRRPVTDP